LQKKLLTINSKFTYLQSSSIVIAIFKTKSFKSLKVNYFYLDLFKDTHLLNDYIVLEKNVFYQDIYMFTQQVRRVALQKT